MALVRAHLELLLEHTTVHQIAAAAGVTPDTVAALLVTGRKAQRWTGHRVANAILSVPVGPTGRVPACATRWRLRALVARGWSAAALCERIGIGRGNVTHLLSGRTERVALATQTRVAELYASMWDEDVPEQTREQRLAAARARSRADRHGWPVPAGLDDDRIDDPSYSPRRWARAA